MSDEYISREKTLALLKSLGSRDYRREKGTIQDAIKMISSSAYTPAADVAEVHHARWEEADWREYDAQSGETIRFPKAAIVCSDCRNAFKKGSLRIQSFCPACGAKMDGEPE